MNWDEIEKKATQEIKEALNCPIDEYDPWDAFPLLYGSYSSEFDDMAIHTLENILNAKFDNEDLAHEMFREMLCNKDLCDYGTSPRTCFPTTSFKEILLLYIEKWKEYYKCQWDDEYKPVHTTSIRSKQ